jgi:1,4-alpha-glucan branching enzyme
MTTVQSKIKITPELQRILDATHHDPFSVLGRHPVAKDKAKNHEIIRAFIPRAAEVRIADSDICLQRIGDSDLFQWQGDASKIAKRYRFNWIDSQGHRHIGHDPYCFESVLSEFDLHLFGEGKHWHAYSFLGARIVEVDGVSGVLFATWAPNAERISVVGEFNHWDGRCHPMRVRGGSGIWELFIPELQAGSMYKFEIRSNRGGQILLKSDPYGRFFEVRPSTASIVTSNDHYAWQDNGWMSARAQHDWLHTPMSIYEVHLGSWQHNEQGGFLSYRELAVRLVDHVKKLGFTHIELLPITEHPFDGSWGYQTIGYYAPTSRFGTPDDFRFFVDYCHEHGVGVLLDWAPGHFPKDAHGLARFDGSALYEHEDPRRGEHKDWGTLIFNYGRNEVRNFLFSSALYWLEEFHIDGLRVDAVASMLYLDYSRKEGEWVPNIHGGRENLDAIHFVRQLNEVTHDLHPGTMIMAEESTSWPMVSRPIYLGGLGFSMKWNMGWMNDTLEYISKDPIHRLFHHDKLTFSLLYAFSENFILPFSHDEVVHGKGSMLNKMPGDEWQRFANLRLLYCYMFTHPGKKLLFMGCEFGQGREWNHATTLDWYVLGYPLHQGVERLVGDLNRLYCSTPALYRFDFEPQGFEWIDCHDAAQSVLIYLRRDGDEFVITAFNFTPVPRPNYRIGVPVAGDYREILNTDSEYYGGGNMGNGDGIRSEPTPWMGRPHSIELTLPPLAGVVLRLAR